MTTAELTRLLQTLAVKRDALPTSVDNVTLGAILFDAARTLPVDHDVSERVATDALHAWLVGTGSMLRYDAVELRRQLVDWQFIERDGYGRAYHRAALHPARFATTCAAAESLDFAEIVSSGRARDIEARIARKAAHLERLAA